MIKAFTNTILYELSCFLNIKQVFIVYAQYIFLSKITQLKNTL